ncbi:von Willebrand factor type A [Frankia sp. Hr75.2]|nr:von Willebrand factor type A [Frankia sp. Hr75.2]SQD96366.1 von Willebrand factor type A [Parafrankia sp. Ea1.12]
MGSGSFGGRPRPRSALSRRSRVAAVFAGLLVVAGLLATGIAGPAAAAAGRPPAGAGSAASVGPAAMRAVILVDESGSLDDDAVRREKEAAQLLAFSSLTPDSEIAVVGFGSSNGEAGQHAVEVYCPLTKAEPAKQQFFVDCIDRLHRREPSEGADTDHAAAMTQALSILGRAQEGRPSFIFLLTDGRLDVANSPQYGQPGARNTEAQRRVDSQVAAARSNGVQIWPLGFGDADQAALDRFAAGGAQQTCNNLPDNQPKARVVTSPDVVARSLFEAIGSASCAQTTEFDTGKLSPGSPVELTVSIPEISTDGVIAVIKGDSRVEVSYVDPNGKEVGDTREFDGSIFTRSTANGTVESLRVQNPRPGTWKIRLTAPADVPPGQIVGAAAMWQGVLQAVVGLNPPVPQPGQQAVVSVQLQTRDGAIDDPDTLDGIQFGVRMSGDSIEQQTVRLTNDGREGDAVAGDAEYSGHITVPPDAKGALTFVGTIDGPGVVGASTVYTTVVAAQASPITASLQLGRGHVAPGGSLTGSVVVDNTDGQARTLSLQLRNLSNGARATIDPATIASQQRGRGEHRLTVTFGEDTALGATSGTVILVDAANPSTVLAWSRLNADVGRPASLLERFWWLWVLALAVVLALLLLAAWLRQTDRRVRDVSDVTVYLSRGGQPMGHLQARSDTGSRFPFVVLDATGVAPHLDHSYGGGGGYAVTRNRHRVLQLRTADGTTRDISAGMPVEIEAGLALTVTAAVRDDQPFSTVPGSDDLYERAGDHRGSADSWAGHGAGRASAPAGSYDPVSGADQSEVTTWIPGGPSQRPAPSGFNPPASPEPPPGGGRSPRNDDLFD